MRSRTQWRRSGTPGLTDAVLAAAKEKPFLGICLGMQMLFEESDEVRPCKGLGLLPGCIRRIETDLKLPQIGWNALDILRPNAMTEGLENGSCVYFVHSFMAQPADENDLAAVTDYGTRRSGHGGERQPFWLPVSPGKER